MQLFRTDTKILQNHYIQKQRKQSDNMIKAGIIGATGYAGAELVRILMIMQLTLTNTAGILYSQDFVDTSSLKRGNSLAC